MPTQRVMSALATTADCQPLLHDMFDAETARVLVRDMSLRLHDGVVLQRGDGGIVWHNVVACRLVKMSSDELLGSGSLDPNWQAIRLDGSEYPGEQHPAMRVLASGDSVRNEVIGVRNGDLGLSWLRVDASPIDVDGVPHVITVFTDITDELTNQRALRKTLDEMQSRLIQIDLPADHRIRFVGSYRSVGLSDSLGGDFFGAYDIDDSDQCFFIGDVCGHGIGSAGLSSLARNSLRAIAPYVNDPASVLGRLHDIVVDERPDTFLTALFGRIEHRSDRTMLSISSGGHPLPILIRDGRATCLGRTGLFIGMLKNSLRPMTEHELLPGDRVVAYTDGVTDCFRPRLNDDELLERVPTDAPIGLVVDVLSRLGHCRDDEPSDDAAILGFEISNRSPGVTT